MDSPSKGKVGLAILKSPEKLIIENMGKKIAEPADEPDGTI